jgi:glycosyltransferase involved in cell wall biosynthesis
MILLTIITVVYNDSKNLENTILNIIEQHFDNLEYIIIDGGSTDETIEIINKYSNNISHVLSEKDNGIYDAMNKGINLAKGEWINFLNAGDLYFENNFLTQISEFLRNSESNLINTSFIINNKKYNPIINKSYLLRNMPCHQSLFYKSVLLKNYKFSLQYKYCSDFFHLIENYNQLNISRIEHLKIRYLGGGFSANKLSQEKILYERLKIVLQSNLNFIYKLLFFIINKTQLIKFKFCSFL